MLRSSRHTKAVGFYSTPEVVEKYETGRINRVIVPDLPRVLRTFENNRLKPEIPLYAMFDWLYWRRLASMGVHLLSGTVLDIACGTSYVYRSMMATGWTGAVTGIDASLAMIEAGTKGIRSLRASTATNGRLTKGIHWYTDPLGRHVIDIASPSESVDVRSVEFMLTHRSVGDLSQIPHDRFDHVTAFSGPLCFFPVNEQKKLVSRLCERADQTISIQFKNAGFARFGRSTRDIKTVEKVVDFIFAHEIKDSLSYLKSMQLAFEASRGGEPIVQHEVGDFNYHTTSIKNAFDFAASAGFIITRHTTLGFVSENLFGLAAEYHRRASESPERLLRFFYTLTGIDDYFCDCLLLGDNLHISASPRREGVALGETVEISGREQNFRTNYVPRTY